MRLEDYLERIGYEGAPAPDFDSLREIHRRHLLSIPYENFDVQLQRPVDLDPERIFEKLVTRRRGGWCYEMNGLLCWALGEIGFEVTRMVGGVLRTVLGDEVMGNHLVLRVDLDGPVLADVGLGDGILEPIPLSEGAFEQGERVYRLEKLDGEFWRFHNHAGAIPPNFDFCPRADEARLETTCRKLQDDPESLFRQHLLCMQPDSSGAGTKLIGRVLAVPGEKKRVVADADEFCATLASVFGLEDPGFRELWPQLLERHRAMFGDRSPEEIFADG
jgi:N-hydroxyarylamine O-acetyltransferase